MSKPDPPHDISQSDTILVTTQQLVDRNDAISMRYLRRLLFNRKENGLAPYVHRVKGQGRKLFIDEKGFIAWLKSQPD